MAHINNRIYLLHCIANQNANFCIVLVLFDLSVKTEITTKFNEQPYGLSVAEQNHSGIMPQRNQWRVQKSPQTLDRRWEDGMEYSGVT
jgi:hypothetical protein